MSTDELNNKLKEYDSVETFIQENESEFDENAFTKYLNQMLNHKGQNPSAIAKKLGKAPSYLYEILNNTKKHPSKDVLLQIAFALELNLEETNRLIILGGMAALRSKIRRESVIIFGINKNLTLAQVDELLYEYNLPTLGRVAATESI